MIVLNVSVRIGSADDDSCCKIVKFKLYSMQLSLGNAYVGYTIRVKNNKSAAKIRKE